MDNQCPNGYTSETFMESFAGNDEELKRCTNCSNMQYDEGTATCALFNKNEIKK